MFVYSRENRYCAELDRTPAQFEAWFALPEELRPRRLATHHPDSIASYGRCLCRYFAWCRKHVGRPFSADPMDVLAFLKSLRHQMGIPGQLMHRTAINTYLVSRGRPRLHSLVLSRYQAELAQQHSRVQATPFELADCEAMCRAAIYDNPVIAARNTAMLMTNFATFSRTGETVALEVGDVEFVPREGMRVRIAGTPFHHDERTITVPYARITPFCPVRLLEHWLRVSRISEGPLFRSVRFGYVQPTGIGPEHLSRIYKTLAGRAGIRGKITGYSPRRGAASVAIQNGASYGEVRPVLGHEFEDTTRLYDARLPVPFEKSIIRLVTP